MSGFERIVPPLVAAAESSPKAPMKSTFSFVFFNIFRRTYARI